MAFHPPGESSIEARNVAITGHKSAKKETHPSGLLKEQGLSYV
jgi:hypothetical protein